MNQPESFIEYTLTEFDQGRWIPLVHTILPRNLSLHRVPIPAKVF